MARSPRPVKGVHAGGAAWTQIHAAIAAYGLDLLVEQGYGRFTVDNLAAYSGINRRTIYRHYPTRIEMALAAVTQMPLVTVEWPQASSPRDALNQACLHASFLPLRLPRLLATAVTHATDTPELLAGVVHHVVRPRTRLIETYLNMGRHEGWIRPDIQATQVSALVNGLLIEEALGTIRYRSRAQRAERVADAIWHLTATDPHGDGTARTPAPARASRRTKPGGARPAG